MKKASKFFVITVLGLAFSAATFAQVAVATTATATIVTPIAISKTSNLAFGSIAVGTISGGTAIVGFNGTRSFTGTCSGPAGGVTSAAFTVTGTNGASFTITLPASVTLSNGAVTMTLDTWDNELGVGPSYTLTGGSVPFRLGGTLHVAAAQATGAYTASFDVEVGYN